MRNFLIGKNNSPNLTVDFEITSLFGKQEFDRINELAALLCQVPVSIISLVDDKGKIHHFPFGADIKHHSEIDVFCRYAINNGDFIEVKDALNDDRFKGQLLTPGRLTSRFYAAYPLTDKQGKISGVLSVLDDKPGKLSADQKKGLQLLVPEIVFILGERKVNDDYKNLKPSLKESIATNQRLKQELIEQSNLVKQQCETINAIKEYKFLADSIPQSVWTSNPDGTVDYYNQYWFDYTGVTLEEFVQKGWDPVLHPDDIASDLKAWTEALLTGKPYERENRFRRWDGVYRWHISRALPFKNEDGDIIKWFGSCIDIDEYKRAIELENKISQFEDFNRIVAHNLRGPANSIGMILDMVNDSSTDEEYDSLFEMLKKSSGVLSETLNELMKVLEIRNNKNLPFEDCNFYEVMAGIDAMLKGQIVSKNANIVTGFQVASMKFPKMYLESIFYNVISNALKYSKPDLAPEILITSKFSDGSLVLKFSDNGLGIDLNKHGENMFKLNSVFHNGFDSKGVGLFMTKTQIETFGGKISVESAPDAGTTFTIVF